MADDPAIFDPHGSYYFELQIGSLSLAQFTEASGLKTSTTVFEIEEGGVNHMVHKLPGQSRYENIILKFGVTGSVELLEWRNMFMKDNSGEEVMRWEFVDAWPVSYEGPSFNSGSSDIAIETFELAHHGLKVTKGESS